MGFPEVHPCIQQGSVDSRLRAPALLHGQPLQVGWLGYSLIKETGHIRQSAHLRML